MVLALLNPGHAQLEMGGGKEKRAARRARSTQSRDDEDDMMSVAGGDLASVLGESDGEEESGLDNAYLLEEAVEKLYNKRGSTRLQGLRALINMLQMSILANELEHQAATVSELCLKSIRHGGTEMTLAAQCLSLLHLQVPEACQDAYEEVRTELRHLVHGMSGEPTPLISCLRTLTLICYVCGNDMVDLEETLLDLEPLLRRKDISPDLMAEGYEAAALCLARMPQSQARKHFERLATNSVRLLEDEETPLVVKEGAGLLLCTLFELVDEAGETVDTTEATEMARQLSKESSKHKAKKDLKEQRAFFRRVYRFFDEGEIPEETLSFGAEKLELEGWQDRAQITLCRKVLESGVPLHLAENVFLREIFQLGAVLPKGTAATKRVIVSKRDGKGRDIARKKQRDSKGDRWCMA